MALYLGSSRAVQVIKELSKARSSKSAEFVENYNFRSNIFLLHIRYTAPEISYANIYPFVREFNGPDEVGTIMATNPLTKEFWPRICQGALDVELSKVHKMLKSLIGKGFIRQDRREISESFGPYSTYYTIRPKWDEIARLLWGHTPGK